MRVPVVDAERVKAAAKFVVRDLPSVPLSKAHEAFARALGYRDWHDFSSSAQLSSHAVELSTVQAVIASVAQALGTAQSSIQYAISRARLLGGSPWSIDEHLHLQGRVWRDTIFGAPGRGKPGTVVRLKIGRRGVAYLSQFGRPTRLIYDNGPGYVGDYEISNPRTPLPDFVPLRLWLPYGFWTLHDGSEVIFSRDYLPLWHVTSERVERIDPWLWIGEIKEQSYFFEDATAWTSPTIERARCHLAQRRVAGLPRLVDALPILVLDPELASIGAAVKRLLREQGGREPPSFAKINPSFSR